MARHNYATSVLWWLAVFAIGLVATAGSASAQRNQDDLEVRYSPTTGLASFVTPVTKAVGPAPRTMAPVRDQSLAMLRRHGQLFGITDPGRQLRARTPWADSVGHYHTKYEEFHRGVRVFAGTVNVHLDSTGELVAANGDFFPIPDDFDIQPRLSREAAISVARATIDIGAPTVEQAELVIVDPGWFGDPSIGAQLAYYIILADPRVPLREAYFVGAHSGKIIDRWNLQHTIRFRAVFDGEGTDILPGTLVRIEDGATVGTPADADRAYDYGGDVYDYFFRAFGRDSYDNPGGNLGSDLIFTVNSTAPTCPNAFWSGGLQQMVFCDGTVTDDITAHEMTHGVIDFTAELIYQNQSGQLNESFADVFGELVDLFNGNAAFSGPPGGSPSWPAHPTDPGVDSPNNLRTGCTGSFGQLNGVRWLMGEDAFAFGGALRDMWQPSCFEDPDTANSTDQDCDPSDNGGVHHGSGIPNHAFAILTDGKTFNGQTVTGIGPIKSAAVWYRALSTYLTPGSDFEDAYMAFNQAASDLIGTTPLDPRTGLSSGIPFTATDALQVDKALRAVEMDTPGRCGQTTDVLDPAPFPACANRATIFVDEFESGFNGWSVSVSGPAGPPTPYNWIQTSDIPFGRTGTAWFGDDRNIGNCGSQNETAVHSLFSPVITLPAGADHPVLSFTHYLATEAGWDGGNVKIRVNGGSYQLVPSTAFLYNPYNAELNRAVDGNTNPLQGAEGWTGPGGKWGTSLIDLSDFALVGQTIQIRFDLGKDGCAGLDGWYVDDFEVYDCPDCDGNGTADHRDFDFTAASGPLGNIGFGSSRAFVFAAPEAASNVVVAIVASGDFDLSNEFIDVHLGGTTVGRVFQGVGIIDCPNLFQPNLVPYKAELEVAANEFNSARSGGSMTVNLTAPSSVDPARCNGKSFVSVFVQYDLNTPDCSGNLIPDSCENDEDLDGHVDDCDLCPATIPGIAVDADGCPPLIPGDFERDGDVDLLNFEFWKDCNSGPDQSVLDGCSAADLSSDGRVDLFDYTLFEGCFSSANEPGDPACAD